MSFLETARLVFREMSLADRDFVGSMLSDPEVMHHYPQEIVKAGAEPWIERQLGRYRRDGHGLWLVLDKVSGGAVGQVGLSMQDVNGVREPEVGYLIHRPFWRRGLATEAATAVRDHAFTRLALTSPRTASGSSWPGARRPRTTRSSCAGDRLHELTRNFMRSPPLALGDSDRVRQAPRSRSG